MDGVNDIVEAHCYVVDNLQIDLDDDIWHWQLVAGRFGLYQLCTNVMKTYLAKMSYSQLSLFDSAYAHQDEFASYGVVAFIL